MTATDTIVSRRGAASEGLPRRIMTGDRFCTRCGYNLVGQEIVREEHYSMLVVRCPECATVTALQEYPRLSTWGPRWGIVLAGLWMIMLLCLWPASSGIMLGFGIAMGDDGSRNYARHLSDLQSAAEAEAADRSATPATAMATAPQPPTASQTIIQIGGRTIMLGGYNQQFKSWWAQQDQQAVLADAGGWWKVFDRTELLLLIPAGTIVFLLGCLWSVFLLQVPRRRLVYCAAAVIGLACVLALIPVLEWDAGGASSARRAAQYQLGLPTLVATFSVLIVPLSLGLWLGRPLTRLAVNALLPPRLRGPLALLWSSGSDRPIRPAG